MSDLEEALPHTHKCMNVNLDNTEAKLHTDIGRDRIRTKAYSWGEGTGNLQAPYDVILGSDVIYQTKLAKLFVKGLLELSGSETVILISYKYSIWGLGEHVTFELMKRNGFVIETIDKSYHPCDFKDSDYDILHIHQES